MTENPVESGSTITDNVVMTPRPFEVSGVMVDYNPESPLSKLADSIKIRDPDFINQVAIPCQLKSITSQTISRINKVLDMAGSAATQAVGGQSGVSWLAKKFPNLLPPGVANLTVSDTRIADLYSALRSVQMSSQPVTVITETSIYQNVMLLDVKVRTNKEGMAVFTLPFKEIFIVDTQKAGGVKVPSDAAVGKTGGRTSAQTSKQTNKGDLSLPAVDPGFGDDTDADIRRREG
ncbi:hypothetical protein D4T62_10525 [Salmonella enterica subsp. enterica]|nr:hypothetical protein [Salmonella enterica subsp. enterica]